MKIPFGIYQDSLVHISELPSGRTEVQCPYCQRFLIAKKGKIKRHHFAHEGDSCMPHFSNDLFGFSEKLPLQLALSVFARQKKTEIEKQLQDLTNQKTQTLQSKNTKNSWVTALMTLLEQMQTSENGKLRSIILEIKRQVSVFLEQKIARFPEFHLLKSSSFLEGFTDGKTSCEASELNDILHEYFYPKRFEPYISLLKNFHTEQTEITEITSKHELFQKDLAHFNRFELYFIQIITEEKKCYKIGLTSRGMEIRMLEIAQNLKAHFTDCQLKLLFTKKGVAFLEAFFKQKYEPKQLKIGQFTEYFDFSDREAALVLKDLQMTEIAEMPNRNTPAWVYWAFFRFSGKLYGNFPKSIYIGGEKFILSPQEEEMLFALLRN